MNQEIISLTEHQATPLPPATLSEAEGELLWRHYGSQITVEFPSPKTEGQWQLTNRGWVGHIPLTPQLTIVLEPKISLRNLFLMLEYAYHLNSFRFLDGLVQSDHYSLTEFYERLAHQLARRIIERHRKGFYHTYLKQKDTLPYVRGRVRPAKRASQINLSCEYEEYTADIEENQILAWTLFCITRSRICTERVLPIIRQAYRALQNYITLKPHTAQSCLTQTYHRLNEDYQPMHALCRFFLEQSGPSHNLGDHKMLPFLVDMARLYEKFVAEWLKTHLSPEFRLKIQEKFEIGETKGVHFDIDLVLEEVTAGRTHSILDTKYKVPAQPATSDISQVIAYAEAKQCREAILIYPRSLPQPLDERVGQIRVRTLAFELDHDLEQAGQTFKQALFN